MIKGRFKGMKKEFKKRTKKAFTITKEERKGILNKLKGSREPVKKYGSRVDMYNLVIRPRPMKPKPKKKNKVILYFDKDRKGALKFKRKGSVRL